MFKFYVTWTKNVEELPLKREHSHTRCIQINSDIIVTSPRGSSGKKVKCRIEYRAKKNTTHKL